ncbi:MAG: hypothetical protein ACWA6Y_05385 [Polaromonas sp.]
MVPNKIAIKVIASHARLIRAKAQNQLKKCERGQFGGPINGETPDAVVTEFRGNFYIIKRVKALASKNAFQTSHFIF